MIIVNNNWNFEVVAKTNEVLRLYNKFLPAVCKYKNHTVYISEDVSSVELPKILLHELCHIVLYETQITLHEYYTEENVCEFISKYFFTIQSIYEKVLNEPVIKTLLDGVIRPTNGEKVLFV